MPKQGNSSDPFVTLTPLLPNRQPTRRAVGQPTSGSGVAWGDSNADWSYAANGSYTKAEGGVMPGSVTGTLVDSGDQSFSLEDYNTNVAPPGRQTKGIGRSRRARATSRPTRRTTIPIRGGQRIVLLGPRGCGPSVHGIRQLRLKFERTWRHQRHQHLYRRADPGQRGKRLVARLQFLVGQHARKRLHLQRQRFRGVDGGKWPAVLVGQQR